MPTRRVLIIDDDDAIREVTKMCLEMVGGFNVLAASSGNEGIAIARAESPDAILLDVMMPELDGPATLRQLQSDDSTRQIPVVMLTAKVQASDRQDLEALGIQGLLAKPFNPLTLADEISSLLGWT
jgi:CheY-like chemotaxis protein